jgi:hypothetical protein
MTSLSPAERVELGATLLDTSFPGWIDAIDLDALNLESPCTCILGQKFGDFYDGAAEIGHRLPSPDWEDIGPLWNSEAALALEELGFFVACPGLTAVEKNYVDAEYKALTEEWAKLIETRRLEAALAETAEPVLV